jgi:hypothetical protein
LSRDVSGSSSHLELTVPEGWRLVELDRVLAEDVPDLMIAALGDELDTETQRELRDDFRSVRAQVAIERVVLLALRLDQDRRDVMTVALHDPAGSPAIGRSGSSQMPGLGSKPAGETVERVSVGDREAIVHTSSVGAADPETQGSWAQVVVIFSSGEGAAVTFTSSAAAQEDGLRAEALAVAGSLALVPDAPVEA